MTASTMSQPVKLRRYYLPSESSMGGWAEIVIGSNGFFAAVSDYGNYSFAWRRHGCADFREFLLNAPRDWDYFAHKLGGEHSEEYDGRGTLAHVRETILSHRRDSTFTREMAREEWDRLSTYNDLSHVGDFQEWYQITSIGDAWEMARHRVHPQLEHFCKVTLGRLSTVLRAELAAEAEAAKGAA